MKYILSAICLLVLCSEAISQSFDFEISPKEKTGSAGLLVSFDLKVTPINGYDASINWEVVSSPCLSSSDITFTPPTSNFPYTGSKLNIRVPKRPGNQRYTIVVKGKNGSLQVADTCYLNCSYNPTGSWFTYNTKNSGLLNEEVNTIHIDKQNVKWLTVSPNYYSSQSGVISCNTNSTPMLVAFNDTNWHYYGPNFNKLLNNCATTIENFQPIAFPSVQQWESTRFVDLDTDNEGNQWIATNKGLLKYHPI